MTKKAIKELSISMAEKKSEHKKFSHELREIVNQKKHVELIEEALKVNTSIDTSDHDDHYKD